MKMFVANATKQVVNFMYRVPETLSLRSQDIAIGSQVQLSGDLDQAAIDYVIEQHARYGMVAADEVNRAREFTGLCYSIDKPVKMEKIETLIYHNVDKLVEFGKQMRQEAALSAGGTLDQALDDADAPSDAIPKVRNFEMSVVEENHDDRDERPAVAEGIRVTRDEGQQPQRQRRRR
jgi:hypothetical protein